METKIIPAQTIITELDPGDRLVSSRHYPRQVYTVDYKYLAGPPGLEAQWVALLDEDGQEVTVRSSEINHHYLPAEEAS